MLLTFGWADFFFCGGRHDLQVRERKRKKEKTKQIKKYFFCGRLDEKNKKMFESVNFYLFVYANNVYLGYFQ